MDSYFDPGNPITYFATVIWLTIKIDFVPPDTRVRAARLLQLIEPFVSQKVVRPSLLRMHLSAEDLLHLVRMEYDLRH